MNTNKLFAISIFTSVFLVAMKPVPASAHCEIPCGIYGDHMRVDMLQEHFKTVEKSMKEISKLEKTNLGNANQLVRWIVNKDEHANKIQTIVYQYFMNQRIKPAEKNNDEAYEKYVTEITLLHRMLVQSMKCKQTTDVEHVQKLRELLKAFEQSYFDGENKASASDAQHQHMHGKQSPPMMDAEHQHHMMQEHKHMP